MKTLLVSNEQIQISAKQPQILILHTHKDVQLLLFYELSKTVNVHHHQNFHTGQTAILEVGKNTLVKITMHSEFIILENREGISILLHKKYSKWHNNIHFLQHKVNT